MTFISVLLRDLERSSPGSGETAKQVLSMLGGISPKSALFVGDEIATPQLISERFGCRLVSAFTDEIRVQQGSGHSAAPGQGAAISAPSPMSCPRARSILA